MKSEKNLKDIQYLPIAGFEGYFVKQNGDVVSERRPNIGLYTLTARDKGDGYKMVGLMKDGKNCAKAVHRIVAETFLPNPNGLRDVNHIDGNKSNNQLSNLEWCTHKQNMEHARKMGLLVSPLQKGENIIKPKLSLSQVTRIRKLSTAGKSGSRIARQFGVTNATISRIINEQCWKVDRTTGQLLVSKTPWSKLDWGKVKQVRKLHDQGHTCVSIAREFSVHHSTISRIVRREGWKVAHG